MSTVTSHPPVPAAAAGSAPTAVARRLPSYAVVGSVCTVVYLTLFWMLSLVLPSMAANIVAMLTTTVANTAANRRFTFGVTGRAGAVRDHAGGLIAFLIGLGISTLSLSVLPSDASQVAELTAVILANALSSTIRFVLLQGWVFNPRLRPAARWRVVAGAAEVHPHGAPPSSAARKPCRSYDRPPARYSRRASASFASRARPAASTSSIRSAATTTTPSPSITTASPGQITAPPTTTCRSIAPRCVLVAPRTRIHRVQTGRPSSRSVSASRTEPLTGTPAARDAAPRDQPDELLVDQPLTARRLVHRRHTEPGRLTEPVVTCAHGSLTHRAPTTFGTIRWNASAWRMAFPPVTLRAWLATVLLPKSTLLPEGDRITIK